MSPTTTLEFTAATRAAFDAYREVFREDVRALVEEIRAFRTELAATSVAFDADAHASDGGRAASVSDDRIGGDTGSGPSAVLGGDDPVEEQEPPGGLDGTEVAEETVTCRVCGGRYGAITASHLRTHDMTMEAYRERYGEDVPLWPDGGEQ